MEKKNIASNIFHIVGISFVIVGLVICGFVLEHNEKKSKDVDYFAMRKDVLEYIQTPITSNDFEFPNSFKVGDITFTMEVVGSWASCCFDDSWFFGVYDDDFPYIAWYEVDYDWKYYGTIIDYFNNNYRLIAIKDPCFGEEEFVYVDDDNDSRMFVTSNSKGSISFGIVNRYRLNKAIQIKADKKAKEMAEKESIANAGKINF